MKTSCIIIVTAMLMALGGAPRSQDSVKVQQNKSLPTQKSKVISLKDSAKTLSDSIRLVKIQIGSINTETETGLKKIDKAVSISTKNSKEVDKLIQAVRTDKERVDVDAEFIEKEEVKPISPLPAIEPPVKKKSHLFWFLHKRK